MAIKPTPEPVEPPIIIPATMTDEQFEDTRDGLRAWLKELGDMGNPGVNADNGTPYTTVSIAFAAVDLEGATEKFKAAVMELQGTNGFYVRTLPDLSFDGNATYQLRARVAPKHAPQPKE